MKDKKSDQPPRADIARETSQKNCGVLPISWRALLFVFFSPALAFAQAAEQHMSPAQFITSTVWYFLIGFAVYWMLVLKPSQAKQDAHKEFLDNLKKNDEVLTSGGIYGRVVGVKPEFITLEIAPNVRVKVKPEHCSSPKSAGTPASSNKTEKAS